jgi:phosphoglucosamine mutase
MGAKTYLINAEPDGYNINTNAGSTHIEVLQKFVLDNGLDVGFAYDGDADRCICVDEKGNVVNGDHILYVLSQHLRKSGDLVQNTVVTTIMSNLGLYRALDEADIRYEQTTVGDRYVYENMQQNGYCIGGEQSGHIILSKYATTGDGILTAIKIMEAVISAKLPLSKLAEPVKMLPQMMKNIRVADKKAVRDNAAVQAALQSVKERLGDSGRILLRESGTEPVVRVMVESLTEEMCESYAQEVVDVILKEGLA